MVRKPLQPQLLLCRRAGGSDGWSGAGGATRPPPATPPSQHSGYLPQKGGVTSKPSLFDLLRGIRQIKFTAREPAMLCVTFGYCGERTRRDEGERGSMGPGISLGWWCKDWFLGEVGRFMLGAESQLPTQGFQSTF